MLDERTFRTGSIGGSSAAARAAGREGSVTAWRSFEQSAESRWAWVEVIPYRSIDEAVGAVPNLSKSFVTNNLSQVKVVGERSVEGMEVPNLTNVWAFEQSTYGKMGESKTRYLAGNVDQVLILVSCSGYSDGWPWDEVRTLTSNVGLKIREATSGLF
jgi:hypothetical protein